MPRVNIDERIQELQVDKTNFDLAKFQEASTRPVTEEVSPEAEGFVSGVKEAFGERVETAAEAQVESIEGKQGLLSGTLQTLGQAAGFVGDIGFEALKAITPGFIEKPVGEAVTAVAGEVAETETAQKLVAWAEANPEAAKNLEAIANIGALVPGVAATAKGVSTAKGAAVRAGEKITETVGDLSAKRAAAVTQQQVDKALESTMGVLTKKEREAAIKAGNVETVGGVIKPKPTPRDIERANIVAPFVEDNFIKSRDNISAEIIRIANEDIRPALQAKPSPFNQAQFKKQLMDIEIPTAFKADKTLENTYTLVRQRMIDVLEDHPNTMEGLYDARIAFDRVLVDEFGDAAFSSRSTVKRAARDIRSKVNEFINTQVGDDVVKESLRKQHLMFESIENIAEQNQKLFETTRYQRWAKENPKLDKILKLGGASVVGATAYELAF